LLVFGLLALALLTVVASGSAKGTRVPNKGLNHFSQSVALRQWLADPDSAPAHLQGRVQEAAAIVAAARTANAGQASQAKDLFNLDDLGLPQNEESVGVCRDDTDIVLGSTNDFRGLLDPEGNFTGWHLSLDSGKTVANEGLMPPVSLPVSGVIRPSGGDPVTVFDEDCNAYGASLAYDPADPFGQSNGIAVYKSDPETLASCPGGPDPSCWPARRAVAETAVGHFLDKEWIHVGDSGAAGPVVWAVYADFVIDETAPLGFTSASIKAVRCDAELVSCTDPILISGDDRDVQFADVTVGPDGRTYVTWSQIIGELPDDPAFPEQTFVHKLRIAPAGSTEFGPPMEIFAEGRAIPFGGFLHANDFRVATYPKHEVVMLGDGRDDDDDGDNDRRRSNGNGGGAPRIFVVWDACGVRLLAFVCEEAEIKLSYSDDDGASWSEPAIISKGGDNYFPAIAVDPASRGRRTLALAWFTNREDAAFHNRQGVDLVTVDAERVKVTDRRRVTRSLNETEADPLLGGVFIGDYIEVFAHHGAAWVHYNANYRQIKLLGAGVPVNQQDNFMRKMRLGN
jgi:hypothetical protein